MHVVPFTRRSVFQHIIFCGVLLVLLLIACQWLLLQSINHAQGTKTELQAIQKEIEERKNLAKNITSPNRFLETLPTRKLAERLVHDIGQLTQKQNGSITVLTVNRNPIDASELHKLQFEVDLSADYSNFKQWIADLLSQYPSLAVQKISIVADNEKQIKQTIRVNFNFWVRD